MNRSPSLLLSFVAHALVACSSGPITVGLDHRFNDDQRVAVDRRMTRWNERTNEAHQFAFSVRGEPDVFIALEVPVTRDGVDDGVGGRFLRPP